MTPPATCAPARLGQGVLLGGASSPAFVLMKPRQGERVQVRTAEAGRAAAQTGREPREVRPGGWLTFFAEGAVIRAALAILLTLGVTVTLPSSFERLEAAAFAGKLYPEQKKT